MNYKGNLKVVDDFYDDPISVRKLALRTEYNDFGKQANFAGKESKKPFYTEKIIDRFEELLGNRILVNPQSLVFGKFRYSTKKDKPRTKIHFDKVDWAGIIYLTLNEYCEGGLGIYKNIKTGLSEVPDSKEKLMTYNCRDIIEFDQKYVLPNTLNDHAWELLDEIPMKFNRLILFRGSKYFHGITKQFGDSIIDSRLSQVFFFNEFK